MNKEEQIELGKTLISEQKGIVAAFAASLWSGPILVAWFVTFKVLPAASGVFLGLSGVLIGLAFKLYGKGVTRPFQMAAVMVFFVIVLSSAVMGITISGRIHVAVVFGLFISGVAGAVKTAKRSLTPDQKSAMWRINLSSETPKPHYSCSWWFLTTFSTLLSFVICFVVMVFSYGFK